MSAPVPRPGVVLARSLLALALLGVALLGVAVLLGVTLAAPVQAHPFGDPQRADITSTADGVQVRWQAAPDDVTALALHLGVLEATRSYVFQDGVLVPAESSDADGVTLARSPELADYLRGHVVVSSGAVSCDQRIQPVENVALDGVTLVFDCGGPVRAAEIRIDLLVDLHDAYRTFATGPEGQRTVYTASTPTHTWEFPATGGSAVGSGGSMTTRGMGAVAPLVILGGGLAAAAAGFLLLRGRIRS